MGSDFLVKFITKRRKGFFQPEFRLWALIPIFILCPIGLFLWAAGIQNLLPSMVPIVGWGILYLAICAIPAVAFTYVVDCYKPEAGECSTILVAFKNSFAFGISFAVVPWVMKDGFVKVRISLQDDPALQGGLIHVFRLRDIISSLGLLHSWRLYLCISLANAYASGRCQLMYDTAIEVPRCF